MTNEELLRGLVAARAWRGALHPRGSDGRFIDVGGFVKWLAGGDRRVGEVTDVRASRDGKPLITVKENNGRVSVLKPEQLSTALKPKAHLNGGSEVGAKSGISPTPKAHLNSPGTTSTGTGPTESASRGFNLKLSDEMMQQVQALLKPPTSTDQIDQDKKIGPMLVDQIQQHPDGFGTHWTTNPKMAETAAWAGNTGGLPVIVKAKYAGDAKGEQNQSGDNFSGEDEITLKPNANVEVEDVLILDGSKWISVWPEGGVAPAAAPVSPQVEEAASRLYSEAEHKGFTGRPTESGLTKPETGFAVAIKGHTLVVPPDIVQDKAKTKKLMQEWFDKQATEMGDNPNLHFGGWTDDETGEVYLDLSEVYPSQSQAEEIGSSRDEIEIWDIANGSGIPIGGTGGRDNVAVAADGGRRDGPDPEATVRVPLRLVGADPGAEGRLLGGSPERHPAGRDRRVAASGAADAVTPTRDELRLRVHAPALVAAAKGVAVWDSGLHPRGRDGRFIDVGSIVRFLVGGTPHTGKVDGINADKTGKGDSKISVTDGSGKSYTLDPGDVLRSVPVRGRINPTDEDSVKVDHDNGHVTKGNTTIGRVTHTPDGKFLAEDIDGNDLDEYETEGDAVDGVVKNAAVDEWSAKHPDVPTGLRTHDEVGDKAAITTGTGTKDDPIVTDDVDVAVKALQEDKYVQLNQADEVATLLDKLAEVANDFKAQGVNAKGKFDLCKVSVPKTNIFCAQAKVPDGLHMPQLGGVPSPGTDADALPKDDNGEVDLSDQFIDHLSGLGIKVTDTQREASHLRASQGQLDGATVAGMMTNANYDPGKKPIFVTRDGYVVDGHHRWAAVTGRSYKAGEPLPMNVREIDANIIDVLALANDFATKMGMPQRTMGEGGPVKPPKSTLVDEVGGKAAIDVTMPALGHKESVTLNAPDGYEDRVRALQDDITYGPEYNRAVMDTLRDMNDYMRVGDTDAAAKAVETAERLAAKRRGKDEVGTESDLLHPAADAIAMAVARGRAGRVSDNRDPRMNDPLVAYYVGEFDKGRDPATEGIPLKGGNRDAYDAAVDIINFGALGKPKKKSGKEIGTKAAITIDQDAIRDAEADLANAKASGSVDAEMAARERLDALKAGLPLPGSNDEVASEVAKMLGHPEDAGFLAEDIKKNRLRLSASAHPWKRYLTMIASGAVQPDSPFLSADGTSWNGQPVPDKVRVAITAPMGKTTDNATASALNELYRTLVLSNGQEVALDSIIQMVDQLETVAASEGTDPSDAKTLQNASKLVRTILAIPDQADLDKAQEKANGKAKSLGGPSKEAAPEEEEAPAEEATEAPAAEATEAPAAEPVTGEASPEEEAPAAPADDPAAALRKRVHGG